MSSGRNTVVIVSRWLYDRVMKVRIQIDTQTFVRFWLVVIGFGLAGWMIYSAREALLIIGTALFLALALNGPVAKMAKYLPSRSRLGSTAIAFVSIIVLLGAVVWFVVPPIIQQSAKFAETIPVIADQLDSQWSSLSKFIDENNLRPQIDSALENIKSQAAGWTTKAGANILGGVGSFASFMVAAFLVIVLSFLMLIEGPVWMERIWRLYSDKQKMKRHRNLTSRVYNVVTGYVTGQLTVSAVGALVSGLFVFGLSLFFAEVPGNLAMPTILIVFVLSLIPMFGATIAGVLVSLILLINNITVAIIYAIFFIVYQQIENNFISPVIQAKKVELSALVILVSVTVGIYVAGLIGGVLAIPVAGTVKVFIEDYLERRSSSQPKKEKPLQKFVKKIRSSDSGTKA